MERLAELLVLLDLLVIPARVEADVFSCMCRVNVNTTSVCEAGEGNFDVVSVLNVLDRCAAPEKLLEGAYRLLKPEGAWLLLATPLPFHGAYFGAKTKFSGQPVEPLKLGIDEASTSRWAGEAQDLLERILPAVGFRPRALSRLPYVCAGDAFVPFYEHDNLLVLSHKQR